MTLIAIFLAVLLDWLIGDPYSWPHPVKWMGSYIYLCMRLQEKRQFSPYLFGFFLWVTTVGLALGVSYGLLWLAGLVHPVLYWIVWIYLAYASLLKVCLLSPKKFTIRSSLALWKKLESKLV